MRPGVWSLDHETMPSTPSILISRDPRRHSPTPYLPPYHTPPAPMAIPRAREPVPPPLPPPSYIPDLHAGHDTGWRWGNDPNSTDFGRAAAVRPGSSLLSGSAGKNTMTRKELDMPMQYSTDRRGSSVSTVTAARDQDSMDDSPRHGNDDSMSRPSSNGLHGARQLEIRILEDASNSYDKQLVSRIGGPSTPSRGSISGASLDNGQLAPNEFERRNSSLRPLSMPERRQGSIDSPASSRWPTSSVFSPGFTGFWQEHGSAENKLHRGSLASEDSASHRGSYDHSMFVNEDFGTEDSQMGNLTIHNRSPGSPKAGSKRRASSPQREREDRNSVTSIPGHGEVYHRRSMHQLPNKESPLSRFHPNHSSVSSASSFGPRHGSLGSSLGLSSVPSSATSYASGRLSPGAHSPATETDVRSGPPYGSNKLQGASSPMAQHQRTFSESTQGGTNKQSTETAAHSRTGSLSQLHGVHMCECCPKKPKKFDTEDELRQHESEKQYVCNYCPNRFKNKNEAERHQNSLHLRRHSWACAALTGIEAAFHTTPSGRDVCGYCGQDFPNPPQWDVRADHLNLVHKFGECNQSKKFFRADHFRQHLKHSHAGTSGKWTNMLENACMKDEPPPLRRGEQAPPALMVTTTGLREGNENSTRIDETADDC